LKSILWIHKTHKNQCIIYHKLVTIFWSLIGEQTIMSFKCPKCLGASMKITSSIELPPDNRSDEITLQTLKCTKCGFTGLGIYEETRRDNLDKESIHHHGIYIDNLIYKSIKKSIRQCPKPKESDCHCKTHNTLNQVNKFGRWNWLEKIPHKKTFEIQIIHPQYKQ
jgi:predicted RNA-binding Zn-ribbon protein involved in translation (DUF1610 family)